MNNLKIVTILESDLFNNDSDFENEEEKLDHYLGDFWIDCDYLLVNGHTFWITKVDNEIIFFDDLDDTGLDFRQQRMVIDFYNNKYDGLILSTDYRDIERSEHLMKEATLAIKYRGGQGYHYDWFVLALD